MGMAALDALDRPEVVRAGESAKYALSIVVTDEVSRQSAAGQLLILAAGRKAIAEGKKPLAAIVARIRTVIAERFNAAEASIIEAEKYLSAQVTASLLAERSASEAARNLEAARVRAAEDAARQAVESGKPVPPPPVQRYIPPVDTNVKTGEAGSVHLTHTLEIVAEDFSKIPETLLQLDAAAARGWANDMIKRGLLTVPKDGTEVRAGGLMLRYRAGLAKVAG